MYKTSGIYDAIVTGADPEYEYCVSIGESGRLILKDGDVLTFGGTSILVGQAGPDGAYGEDMLIGVEASYQLHGSNPTVGECMAAELTVTMLRPVGSIPRMAMVRPYIRAIGKVESGVSGAIAGMAVAGEAVAGAEPVTDILVSEWLPQGVFYIDTREYTRNEDDLDLMTLHCYDAMLMTERSFPETTGVEFPVADVQIVRIIAEAIGVSVDPRTWEIMDRGYSISLPAGYSMREVLGNVGAMYGGNWIMNYDGELLLVALNGIPAETNYLVDGYGNVITFADTRILV